MKLYWRKEEDRKKIRNEFDVDQKEAIGGYCFISFMIGALLTMIMIAINEYLTEHLIWIN